jgi:glutaredoxin
VQHAHGRRVTFFAAPGCHLCEQALAVVHEARARAPFELETVDITGDPRLEAEYRTLLPVIEIDGVRAFTYFVTVEALLDRIRGDGSPRR